MAEDKQKVTLSLEADLVAAIRAEYGERQLSHVVNTLVRQGICAVDHPARL